PRKAAADRRSLRISWAEVHAEVEATSPKNFGEWTEVAVANVLIPIPSRDFDPSEVAVSWSVLKRLGHAVTFATPDGQPGQADDMMITGQGLDPWGFLPGLSRLTAIGRLMRANADARQA